MVQVQTYGTFTDNVVGGFSKWQYQYCLKRFFARAQYLYESKFDRIWKHETYVKQWNAAGYASGIYFYRLSVVPSARRDLVPTGHRNGQTGSSTERKKMILLKYGKSSSSAFNYYIRSIHILQYEYKITA